jgi:hypothetical protein
MISLEYAVVIVCVIAGLIAMQIYLTRAFQGRLRSTADNIGEQYAPGNTTADFTQTFLSNSFTVTNTIEDAGITNTTTVSDSNETQTRVGTERVGPLHGKIKP